PSGRRRVPWRLLGHVPGGLVGRRRRPQRCSVAGHRPRLRRPDQAADHRAAAGHHRPRDVPRRRRRPAAVARAAHHAGRLPRGCQRQRHQLRPRPRHRRADAPHPAPPAPAARRRPGRGRGLRRRAGRGRHPVARLLRQLAVGPAGARRERVLRRRLHPAAQAADVAEHRLGRDRRLLPPADRLDGRHRPGGAGAVRALRHRLLLDAAAHLGAGVPLPRGLRRREGADAPRGRAGPGGRRPDPGLLGRDRGRVARAVARRGHGLAVPGGRRADRCRPAVGVGPAARPRPSRAHRRRAQADAAVPLEQLLPRPGLRRGRGRPAAAL
ncbi:MAG: Heme O synthase, protoheme IX farnesyltransferase COX10-CtaB, partial [uncultured Friedmanniella sp.]